MRVRRGGRAFAFAFAMCAACGAPKLPSPRTGPHVHDRPLVVPYPPPPVRVDVVGPPPSNAKDLVWIDGQWTWSVSRWTWRHGFWAEQRAGEHWAPPVFYRNPNDQLLWFEGTFIDGDGEPVRRSEAK